MQFTTDHVYNGREEKAAYVYNKYKSIFNVSVLDVGADAQYLKPMITSTGGKYHGIGYGDNIDQVANLDGYPLPFEDRSFETVICLDVLEHLDNLHQMFYQCCRVANKYVVISLPNCWSLLFKMLLDDKQYPRPWIKWWGLPLDAPQDRHRWFYSEAEAFQFLTDAGKSAGFFVLQMDVEESDNKLAGNGINGWWKAALLKLIMRSDIEQLGLGHGTIWCVLERNG